MKPCRKCGISKPLDQFHKARDMRDGHRNECKDCWRQIQQAWYQRNRDKAIRASQEWKRKNPEKYAEHRRKYLEHGPNRERKRAMDRAGHLRRKYGISVSDFEFLLASQDGLCAICQQPDGAGLHIDHHHDSGLIRGLLCGKCNKAIGLLKENPALFDAASSYLQRTQLPLGCGDKTRPPTRVRRRTEQPAGPEAT